MYFWEANKANKTIYGAKQQLYPYSFRKPFVVWFSSANILGCFLTFQNFQRFCLRPIHLTISKTTYFSIIVCVFSWMLIPLIIISCMRINSLICGAPVKYLLPEVKKISEKQQTEYDQCRQLGNDTINKVFRCFLGKLCKVLLLCAC